MRRKSSLITIGSVDLLQLSEPDHYLDEEPEFNNEIQVLSYKV